MFKKTRSLHQTPYPSTDIFPFTATTKRNQRNKLDLIT